MTNTFTIRDMRENEADEVIALWQSAGLTRPWNDPHKDISFALIQKNATILLGVNDGEIVASVMVGHDGHRGMVYYVAVAQNFQGHGFGREMMSAAEHWLRTQGLWKLNLMVRTDNKQACSFYRHLGYEISDSIMMQRWLD